MTDKGPEVAASPTVTKETVTKESVPVETKLTWQIAKAQTQAMELEIADLVPEDKVAKSEQWDTGLLFSCGPTQHNWTGSTTVTLTEGVDPESVVRAIESHYTDGRFDIETDIDSAENYRIQLRSQDTAEGYIISKWGPNTISIDSGSACFTLPEGVYPGGDF